MKGTGKMIYLGKVCRWDILHVIMQQAKRMKDAMPKDYRQMLRTMAYCCQKEDRGLYLRPNSTWNPTNNEYHVDLRGRSDSDYAQCKDTRRSVTGYIAYLEGAPFVAKSRMQKTIALSVTEAELMAMVACVQEMIQAKQILEGMRIKVKLPMLIECDNKGAVDLVNGYRIKQGSKHIDIKYMKMREWKERGLIKVRWISTQENEADIFTKNVDKKILNRHLPKIMGNDAYMVEEVNQQGRLPDDENVEIFDARVTSAT